MEVKGDRDFYLMKLKVEDPSGNPKTDDLLWAWAYNGLDGFNFVWCRDFL